MTNPVGKTDYKVRRTPDKPAAAPADAGTAAIVDFLQLLGRAARQFHTYPATSPMCTDAIDACHRAFMKLDIDGPFTFRVAPRTIIVGEEVVGGDTIIEQEVARPLHRVRVASVEIERGVSIRDWSNFCTTLSAAARAAALQQRYDDVVMLISAVDPRLARVLFSKLARAVLRLDADTRRTLLRGAVLPSLLDGRLAGEAVLGEFPDVDLADALCLLLDLEAAAPQLLTIALDRLKLAPERRTSLTPLIEAKLDARAMREGSADRPSTSFDDQARALTRLDPGAAPNVAEFAAFDLSITDQTAATLATLRDAATSVDGADAQIACAAGLARIEPNPAVVTAVLTSALPALRTLIRDRRWNDVTRWVARIAEIEAHVEPLRSDGAGAIRET